ncbi:MAG: efflux RND transporter periplasmic adaptor subunit [Lutibacter sp.]|jgi:cobalt-zinc-cadmium efflux system membrane fusion protein|uniref:efflux RND transporter periplasmic adaptor subunit n=1 Tax=Lutibacter sp. TaxID=1925666 RepID=UPI00299E3308|nr:efflux RND transporter periplasmic adaptor subunit [Lutibacter sp.]MDX1828129.1 efflux RND transporter periplasmic adaptor subunit [Lutibacter sp.]
MKNYIINTLYIISIFTVLVSCNDSKPTAKNEKTEMETASLIEITKPQFETAKMELGNVSLQKFNETIQTNGMVDVPPANRAKVSAIMGGYIKTAPLLVGNKVKKGQLLLTIENPDFIEIQQNYLEVSQKLNYLKSEYDRQKTLFAEKISSQRNFLKAESDYKSALALHNGLSQKLKLMNINPLNIETGKITSILPVYAPITGSITMVNASVGKFMNTSDVLLEIVNNEHKHLELVVFEKDVLKIKKGQEIKFKIPENSNKSYNAEVHLIGKSIDDVTRTVKVHGHLKDENEPFLVGMFVEAQILVNSVEKTALPTGALLEDNGNYYILALKEDKGTSMNFEKVKVNIGSKSEEWVEIIDKNSTLQNVKVLTKGAFLPKQE